MVGSRTSWNPTGGIGTGSGTIGSTGTGAKTKTKINKKIKKRKRIISQSEKYAKLKMGIHTC